MKNTLLRMAILLTLGPLAALVGCSSHQAPSVQGGGPQHPLLQPPAAEQHHTTKAT